MKVPVDNWLNFLCYVDSLCDSVVMNLAALHMVWQIRLP